jgi:hypothetical protein
LIIGFAHRLLESRRRKREARHLLRVEKRRLRAEGFGGVHAWARATGNALALADQAAEIRRDLAGASLGDARASRRSKDRIRAMLESGGPSSGRRGPLWRCLVTEIGQLLVGARTRFLVGALLLAGCMAWVHQNGVINKEIIQQGRDFFNQYDWRLGRLPPLFVLPETTQPLRLPVIPEAFTTWCDSFLPAAAAAILIVSAFVPGLRISFFVFPAALIIVAGQSLAIPPLSLLGGHQGTNLTVGIVLVVIGLFLSRER